MKAIFAGSLVVIGLIGATPAFAQSIDIGPGGPSIDLRSRRERERDIDREEARRDMRREERREMRRRDMQDDDVDRPRRGY
ncbi:hypothetical protein F6X51_19645 [Methylobacterium planeticum]|uniref:Uncharacterized protein n=1 Tax=Methylobacterium planeticum TaxID=2615211 RepID=A0A6N6MMH6_9HYPH|nr:hypothetical protein F6X51_19645 [Methylobacterium planeticum]